MRRKTRGAVEMKSKRAMSAERGMKMSELARTEIERMSERKGEGGSKGW
jgi:hypothetical protein